MTPLPSGFLTIGASDLEYRMIGPAPADAPTIVMLHEGLGSRRAVGRFSGQAAGRDRRRRVRLFARRLWRLDARSTLPRPLDYMHVEALEVLPKLLDAIGFRRGLLVGHSDGASIAAIYAGGVQDHRVRGLALIAPHFIVEDISVTSIAEIKTRLRDHRPQGEAGALAQRCRQRLLRLERRLARSEIPRLGYFGISRLYPRAGRDRAGRRRPVWDDSPDRDRAGRMLLSGRRHDHPRCRTFAASRGAGGDAECDRGIRKIAFCRCMKVRRGARHRMHWPRRCRE